MNCAAAADAAATDSSGCFADLLPVFLDFLASLATCCSAGASGSARPLSSRAWLPRHRFQNSRTRRELSTMRAREPPARSMSSMSPMGPSTGMTGGGIGISVMGTCEACARGPRNITRTIGGCGGCCSGAGCRYLSSVRRWSISLRPMRTPPLCVVMCESISRRLPVVTMDTWPWQLPSRHQDSEVRSTCAPPAPSCVSCRTSCVFSCIWPLEPENQVLLLWKLVMWPPTTEKPRLRNVWPAACGAEARRSVRTSFAAIACKGVGRV
mmetsp:Transcript_4295/g.11651  ORF Transcript_4295/g.11651 Transcript_4295/m.11651 type:complete len:267 (-) Transcript_4295:15-815(-)